MCLSFRIVELRSDGRCGGCPVDSPAQGMVHLRASGPWPVRVCKSPQMDFVQPLQGLDAVFSHSHGKDCFPCAQSELPFVLSLHTSGMTLLLSSLYLPSR